MSILIGISLGFFGGGGSILTVPLLVYVFGLPPKEAIASSLLVVAAASTAAAIQHARAGNLQPRVALVFGVAGMAGAYSGAFAALNRGKRSLAVNLKTPDRHGLHLRDPLRQGGVDPERAGL